MKWSSICSVAKLISVFVLAITYHTNTFVLFFGGIVSLITLELSQLRRQQKDKILSDNRKRNYIRTVNGLKEEKKRYSEQKFVLENELNRKVKIIANLETESNQKVIEIDNLEARLTFGKEQIQNAYEKIEKLIQENRNFKKQLEKSTENYKILTKKYETLTGEHETLTGEYDKIQEEIAKLENKCEQHEIDSQDPCQKQKLKKKRNNQKNKNALKFKDKKLILIGGHSKSRAQVFEIFCKNNYLNNYDAIPPSNEEKICKRLVRAKIENADLAVVITGYIGHDLSNIVKELKHVPRGEVIWIDKRGSTGIVREIEKHLIEKAS